MPRYTFLALSVVGLAACGYTEEKYAEDYTSAMCDNLAGCEADIVAAYVAMGMDEATAQATFDTTYAASCETEITEGGEENVEDTCEFDAAAAQECVDGIEAMSCDFWSTGAGFPEACTAVCG